MRLLFTLIAHVLVTLARLARPGGLGAVVAESVRVKHQLLILKRARRRAPQLTSWDRLAVPSQNLVRVTEAAKLCYCDAQCSRF